MAYPWAVNTFPTSLLQLNLSKVHVQSVTLATKSVHSGVNSASLPDSSPLCHFSLRSRSIRTDFNVALKTSAAACASSIRPRSQVVRAQTSLTLTMKLGKKIRRAVRRAASDVARPVRHGARVVRRGARRVGAPAVAAVATVATTVAAVVTTVAAAAPSSVAPVIAPVAAASSAVTTTAAAAAPSAKPLGKEFWASLLTDVEDLRKQFDASMARATARAVKPVSKAAAPVTQYAGDPMDDFLMDVIAGGGQVNVPAAEASGVSKWSAAGDVIDALDGMPLTGGPKAAGAAASAVDAAEAILGQF